MTTLPGIYAVPGAAWPGSIWAGDIIGASTPVPASPVLFAAGLARNGTTSGRFLTQPATSSQFLQVQVIATLDGAPYDPTSDTAEIAIVSEPAYGTPSNPQDSQFNATSWETDANPATYWASVLVGPAGLSLTAGAYAVAVKVTDGGVARIMWGPVLLVT